MIKTVKNENTTLKKFNTFLLNSEGKSSERKTVKARLPKKLPRYNILFCNSKISSDADGKKYDKKYFLANILKKKTRQKKKKNRLDLSLLRNSHKIK